VSAPTILACRVALSRDPQNTSVMATLAQLLLDAGRGAEAEPVLRTLCALEPGRSDLFTALGNALKQAGRFAEAEEAYRSALSASPGEIPARYNLAVLSLLQGRPLLGGGGG